MAHDKSSTADVKQRRNAQKMVFPVAGDLEAVGADPNEPLLPLVKAAKVKYPPLPTEDTAPMKLGKVTSMPIGAAKLAGIDPKNPAFKLTSVSKPFTHELNHDDFEAGAKVHLDMTAWKAMHDVNQKWNDGMVVTHFEF